VGDTPSEIYAWWQTGKRAGAPKGKRAAAGATALTVPVAAGETRSISLTLGWFFPNHDFNHFRLGNAYARHLKSSAEVAHAASESLPQVLNATASWHSSFYNTSMPVWLADVLVNTLSTWRTGMFFGDRVWRQWETYDCVDTDPVECDASRSLPLIIMYPELFKDLVRGWAKSQCGDPEGPSWWHQCQGDGQISESIAEACGSASEGKPDIPGGRLQGDATTVFTFYVYHLHRWTNDTALLDKLYPNVKRAVNFTRANARASPAGLPYRMDPMWDILALATIDYVFYNSVWYVVSLMAAEQLALLKGDTLFASQCNSDAAAARTQIDETFWQEDEQRWRPINDSTLVNAGIGGGRPNWTMADDFLAQVHATTAGLPMALDSVRVSTHLQHERASNLSPFGMRALTCATPDTKPCNHDPAFLRLHGLRQDGDVRALYQTATARAPEYRRGSIGLARFRSKEPMVQPAQCVADPYLGVQYNMSFVGATPLATIAVPRGSNVSSCQQHCCDWATEHNSSHACVAAALQVTSSQCQLYNDPSSSGAKLTAVGGSDVAWVMWVTPTPGDCPRYTGDPETCRKFANANCEIVPGTDECVHSHPPSACGTPQASPTFLHGDHDSIWGMTTPDFATNAIRNNFTVAEALDALHGYVDNTRVGLRDQWSWAAVTATETTGSGPGGQPWCSAHYFFHVSLWHVPLALSGQDYNAIDGSLAFAPRLDLPLSLPVTVSGAIGTLTLDSDGAGELAITAGELRVRSLQIDGQTLWEGDGMLETGQALKWAAMALKTDDRPAPPTSAAGSAFYAMTNACDIFDIKHPTAPLEPCIHPTALCPGMMHGVEAGTGDYNITLDVSPDITIKVLCNPAQNWPKSDDDIWHGVQKVGTFEATVQKQALVVADQSTRLAAAEAQLTARATLKLDDADLTFRDSTLDLSRHRAPPSARSVVLHVQQPPPGRAADGPAAVDRDGTAERPFTSIHEARDHLRLLRQVRTSLSSWPRSWANFSPL
jgi:hypothetical protein